MKIVTHFAPKGAMGCWELVFYKCFAPNGAKQVGTMECWSSINKVEYVLLFECDVELAQQRHILILE